MAKPKERYEILKDKYQDIPFKSNVPFTEYMKAFENYKMSHYATEGPSDDCMLIIRHG